MTRMERLARRICWMGFIGPRNTGGTEAAYWRGLPEETRDKYLEEARWLCWAIHKLNGTKLGPAILQLAQMERAARRTA